MIIELPVRRVSGCRNLLELSNIRYVVRQLAPLIKSELRLNVKDLYITPANKLVLVIE